MLQHGAEGDCSRTGYSHLDVDLRRSDSSEDPAQGGTEGTHWGGLWRSGGKTLGNGHDRLALTCLSPPLVYGTVSAEDPKNPTSWEWHRGTVERHWYVDQKTWVWILVLPLIDKLCFLGQSLNFRASFINEGVLMSPFWIFCEDSIIQMCLAWWRGHRGARDVDYISSFNFLSWKNLNCSVWFWELKGKNREQHLDRFIIWISALSEIMYFLTYVE